MLRSQRFDSAPGTAKDCVIKHVIDHQVVRSSVCQSKERLPVPSGRAHAAAARRDRAAVHGAAPAPRAPRRAPRAARAALDPAEGR